MTSTTIDENLRRGAVSCKVVRLKDLGTLQNGISKGKDYFGFGYPFVSYGNVYNDTVDIQKIKTLANSSQGDQKQYSVLEGDVFFTRTSETIDEIGISATALHTIPKATFSGFVIRLRPNKRLIKKGYSKYFFKADVNRQFLSREISLVTRASLGQNILNNLPVILPSQDEQTAIANYLDGKTHAIDKKLSLLEKKIGYYQELRKSVINETVTKGLDKNAKLKESRIDLGDLHWIKQIPEHWSIQRLDWIAHLIRGNTGFGKDELLDNGDYVALQYGKTYQVDEVNSSFQYFVNSEFYKHTQIANRGDTILISTSETIDDLGHSCFYNRDDLGLVGGEQILLKPNRKHVFGKYLYYCSKEFATELRKNATGLKVFRFNIDDLKQIFVAIPPLEEQIQIANYLTEKTSRIDQIITNMQIQISTLKELRKTLVNDVVTGKIKVTND